MSELLAFVHSLVTIFSTLYTSLSSYSSTTISMTIITYPMDQQHTLSQTWSQLQYSLQLLHHLADPLGDLIDHIGHLHISLPLHHHLNDDLQLQFDLLASSASIELVSSSARVTWAKSQPKLLYVCTWIETPGPKDRTPGTPGSGNNTESAGNFHATSTSQTVQIQYMCVW